MFSRASRRKLPCDGCRQPSLRSDVLQLPFLCPALYASRLVPKATVTTKCRRDVAKSPTSYPHNANLSSQAIIPRQTQQQRGLASAVDAHELLQDEFVPFESVHGPSAQQQARQQPKVPFDPFGSDAHASPLILDTSSVLSGKFRSADAISGDLNEIHQTLHACLQVGRFERARTLVRRLAQIYKPDAPGLITAHNDYIREVTLRLIEERNPSIMKDLQVWFELEIRQRRIPPDARTYALMIQASSWGVDPDAKDRCIKRYIDLARESGLAEETLQLAAELDGVAEQLTVEQTTADTASKHQPSRGNSNNVTEAVRRQAAPTIKPEAQKGLGLSTLKAQLSVLQDRLTATEEPLEYIKSVEDENTGLSSSARQLALERNTVDAAVERWRKEDAHLRSHGALNVLSTKSMNAILWQWHTVLEPEIKEELQKASEAEARDTKDRTKADEERLLWAPFLHGISTERLSVMSVISCLRIVSLQSQDDRGVRVSSVINAIGASIEEECLTKYMRTSKKYRQWRALTQEGYQKKYGFPSKPAEQFPQSVTAATSAGQSQDFERLEWPSSVRIRVGAMLLSRILEKAKIEVIREGQAREGGIREKQNAFFHTYTFVLGKRIGVIRLNSALTEIMTRAPLSASFAKQLPMVTKPKPWTGYVDGGYLEQPIGVVRLDSSDIVARRYAMAASSNGDMTQIFNGLDVLGSTPWRINRRVFEVMAEAWNSGEEIARIPAEDAGIEIPPEPSPSASIKERMRWLRRVKDAENVTGAVKSQRCFLNFQLEVARSFLDETFYYPHNVDFRGRAYPMAPFLNHMGADNARGLLQFAEKKTLGSVGLRWLKIHLANVFGFDKASFEERQKFTEDHIPDIIDAANNGLHGNRWWLKAEDPWQCLAACMDLKDALDLPDPTKHRSYLAVHQDGTCNGLQHYAALGGDIAGAKQVNLEPGDRPSDIYTSVAEMIKKEITKEAADGDELAKLLDGKITRKVVKQTVMTNVYGVTFIGAQRQVRKQLVDILPGFPDTHDVNLGRASLYIARKIFKFLGAMFNGAHDIQYWLGDCAGRICRSISPEEIKAIEQRSAGQDKSMPFKRKPITKRAKSQLFTTGVIWTTPLNMPVVQSYCKADHITIDSSIQTLSISNPHVRSPIDRSKQLQAFPPNFIHSLDGTHMFLTALKCNQVGLTFAAVHDSFWTHAGDIVTMNSIIREAFIKMHSDNIIERLRAEFETRYKDYMCLSSIPHTSTAGRRIREWRRAHGIADFKPSSANKQLPELLMEVKRLKLLASDNSADREEGAAMVTPGSIYEHSRADERIGAVPSNIPVPLGQASTLSMKLKADEQSMVGDAENADPMESVLEENLANDMGDSEGVDQGTSSSSTKPPQLEKNKTYFWVPLTFPPVPQKGEFDVNRLRHSKYFFS